MPKILVIDDKKDNLISISAILKTHRPSFEVMSAQSGEDGIKLAITEKPDTILLDIIMPVMDGYEVCKQLKKDKVTKHVPVIFLTAIKNSTQNMIKGLELGAEAYLNKPITPGELIAQIDVMLRIKKTEDKLRTEKDLLDKIVVERTKELVKTNTKLAKSKEKIQRSERLNRAITESANDAIISINSSGMVLSWNRAAEKMFGYDSMEILNKNLNDIIPSQHKNSHEKGLQILKSGGNEKLIGQTIEITALKRNKIEFPIELSLSSWESESKKNYTAIIRDITKRKELESKSEMALKSAIKADSVKTLFLANISHEIRTPLTSILGFTDLIEDQLNENPNEYFRECFDQIKNSGDRLMTTVHGILDLSLIESGNYPHNPKPVQISKILEKIIIKYRPIADQRNIELSFENRTEDLVLTADRENLNKALDSIIDNAIKYTEVGKVLIKLDYEYDKCVLKIIDTGVGIDETYLGHIFDAFSQESDNYHKKYQGLGMGMAITKHCLELDGISIAIDSIQGKGTTVTLDLFEITKGS